MSKTTAFGDYWKSFELDRDTKQLCQQRMREFSKRVHSGILARYPKANITSFGIHGELTVSVEWPADATPFETPGYEEVYCERYFADSRDDEADKFISNAVAHIEQIRALRMSRYGRIPFMPVMGYGLA